MRALKTKLIGLILFCLLVSTVRADVYRVFPIKPGSSGGGGGGVIDACTQGLTCDWKTDFGEVVANNGSLIITSPGNKWVAGDVGKLITLYSPDNGPTSSNTFSGTIAGYTGPGQITLSGPYTGTNTTTAQAMWETDNTANWATVLALVTGASTNPPQAGRVFLSKPVMLTSTSASVPGVTFNELSIDFFCAGQTSFWDPFATGGFIWAGPAAGTMVLLHNNLGTRFHDCTMLGSDLAPPYLIREENLMAVIPNANNQVYNIIGGGLQNIGLGPVEGPGDQLGTMAGDHVAGDTSITLASAPVGLQPNGVVRFYDPTSAGGGTEVSRTATTYVAGANPIILRTALAYNHTAALTAVVWDEPAAMAGLTFGIAGSTQNDSNQFWNLRFTGDLDTCLYFDRTPGTAQTVNMRGTDLGCKNFGLGIDMANNGQLDIGNVQFLAGFALPASPGIAVHVGGGAQVHIHALNTEYDACNVAGTNYVFVNGSANEGSGSGGSTVTIDDLITNVSSCMPGNGDIVESGGDPNAYMTFTLNDFKFVGTSDAYHLAPGINPKIHLRTRAGASGQRTVKISTSSIERTTKLGITDDGSTSMSYVRDVEITKKALISGQQPDHFHALYQGEQTVVLGQSDDLSPHAIGGLIVDQVTPSPPTATVIGNTSGPDYYYVERAVDAAGNLSGASGMSAVVQGPTTLDATANYVNVQAGVSIGAVSYNIYQAHVTHNSAAPALSTFGFIGNVANNIVDTSAPRLLLCTAAGAPYACCTGVQTGTAACSNPLPPTTSDVGNSPGFAPSTSNLTGTTNLNGPAYVAQAPSQIGSIQSYGRSVGQSTVANAPSYAMAVIATAPGGYWKMDGAGPDLTDSSGNSNTAVGTGHNTGVAYRQTGLINQDGDYAIIMPGSGTPYFVVAPDATHLPTASTFTVIGSFKRAATNPTAGQALIGQKSGGFLILFPTNSDQLVFRQSPSTNIWCSSTMVSDMLKHWFAVRYNGTKASITIDGADVTVSCGNNLALAPADSTLFIGLESASGSQNANGTLDEFAVYNSYLPDATITSLYNTWAGPKYGTWNWFLDGTVGTCPVTGSGGGCMGLYQPCGWGCDAALIQPTPAPTPTATATQTPVPTATP